MSFEQHVGEAHAEQLIRWPAHPTHNPRWFLRVRWTFLSHSNEENANSTWTDDGARDCVMVITAKTRSSNRIRWSILTVVRFIIIQENANDLMQKINYYYCQPRDSVALLSDRTVITAMLWLLCDCDRHFYASFYVLTYRTECILNINGSKGADMTKPT